MKLECDKETLLKGISTVQNAISIRNTLPILSNILLETQKDNLTIIGTDLDIGIIEHIPVNVVTPGSITVPAKKFMDIIKELPDAQIILSVRKNNMMHIACENSQFKIMGIPKDDFPKIPEFKEKVHITLEQSLLRTMLGMTSFAISRDETRYILNGVYIILKKNMIKMVATDGRRLALAKRDIDLPKSIDKKIIIPMKTVQELQRNLKDNGEVSVFFGDNQVMFDFGGLAIISRLIEGEFPNYEQVIPKETKDKVVVGREKLLMATKRASLLTSQDSQGIKMDIEKGKLVISKQSPDIGEVREELDVDYKGPNFSIGFNPGYIIDVLKNMDEESIGFELENPEKPGVIRTKDRYVYVVLPMQLS
ncbi:MAG: DNA polymerase III subunit beta [Candidatus Omnitrophica bacterium]|nr:DNA polymerase III subunit beta [Candidatus Omnitrophota bacterium]